MHKISSISPSHDDARILDVTMHLRRLLQVLDGGFGMALADVVALLHGFSATTASLVMRSSGRRFKQGFGRVKRQC
jgi:acyl-coenzyme A thioesterase PaaI-like protein